MRPRGKRRSQPAPAICVVPVGDLRITRVRFPALKRRAGVTSSPLGTLEYLTTADGRSSPTVTRNLFDHLHRRRPTRHTDTLQPHLLILAPIERRHDLHHMRHVRIESTCGLNHQKAQWTHTFLTISGGRIQSLCPLFCCAWDVENRLVAGVVGAATNGYSQFTR